ncbi:ATP11 protein-domain-containing protein [Pilobolus umbonatus]|nr:ATP11 protein-domain-containing protein [Pilobolus umbonatus]
MRFTSLPTYLKQQVRYAQVLHSPVFGGHNKNWDRIKHIGLEASKVKIDYDSKYAHKLKQAAEKKGLTLTELKKQTPTHRISNEDKQTFIQKEQPSDYTALDSIVKLDRLAMEDTESIGKIWTEYHATRDGISAVIPASIYEPMHQLSKQYPLFILPLPRQTGLEFFFLQHQEHQCNFTSLLEYKSKGEKSRPFFTMTHYTDLSDSKGIVLMRGDIHPDKLISAKHAHFLAFLLQQFYATTDRNKRRLVETFNDQPEIFDYRQLIKETEGILPFQ